MQDKPYTCALNPLVPAIGIVFSGVTIGYIDTEVWITFFIITLGIAASYFLSVIPIKYRKAMQKRMSFRYA